MGSKSKYQTMKSSQSIQKGSVTKIEKELPEKKMQLSKYALRLNFEKVYQEARSLFKKNRLK